MSRKSPLHWLRCYTIAPQIPEDKGLLPGVQVTSTMAKAVYKLSAPPAPPTHTQVGGVSGLEERVLSILAVGIQELPLKPRWEGVFLLEGRVPSTLAVAI